MLDKLAFDMVANVDKVNSTYTNIPSNLDSAVNNALTNASGNHSAGTKYSDGILKYRPSGNSNNYTYSAPWIAKSGNKYGGGIWDLNTTVNSYGNGNKKVGIYYNYYAASVGTYCYGSGTYYGSSSPSNSQNGVRNINADICPKGWQILTGNSSGMYNNLYTNGYSSNQSNFKTALSTSLSGYLGNGSADGQGSVGSFWSSTRSNVNNMYSLYDYSSSVNPSGSDDHGSGRSVRCVLQ